MSSSNRDCINFYFFRHGQTDWNKERRLQGHSNTYLNELGRKQAHELREKLSAFPIDHMVSSDLSRAFETAQIVNQNWKLKIQIDKRLREASFGEAEGMIIDDLIAKYGEESWLALKGFGDSSKAMLPGGETRQEANSRVESLIEELATRNSFNHIAVSTHGGVVANFLKYKAKKNGTLEVPNCVCYLLSFTRGSWDLKGPL